MAEILSFADRWLGASLPGLLLQYLGILLVLSIASAAWSRRISYPYAMLGGVVGLLMISFALEKSITGFINSLNPEFQIRLFALTVILIVFLVLVIIRAITVSPKRMGMDPGGNTLELGWKNKTVLEKVVSIPVNKTYLAAFIIITVTAYSVFATGIMAPQAMVGDEVTHFYMMTTQAETLPLPNFLSTIPNGWGNPEIRAYHHPFLWHYLGAIAYRFSGGSFVIIQLYHTFFLIQFLIFAYLLASDRGVKENFSATLYLIVLASMPLTLIFSVAFYQDVPMAAQVVTGFYFLRKHRWLLASLFMSLAIGLKVTAILFFPSFFICLFVWEMKRQKWYQAFFVLVLSLAIVGGSVFGISQALHRYANAEFYPVKKLHRLVRVMSNKFQSEKLAPVSIKNRARRFTEAKERAFMANFPGNLRIKRNYLIYGGVTLWIFLLFGGIAVLGQRFDHESKSHSREPTTWLWFVGGSYLVAATCFLWKTPDARFFLPGLPFVLLPVAEKIGCLPRKKWIIVSLASLSIMQGGYVLAKTYNLRNPSNEITEAIDYLREHPAVPRKVFMYPEGNYRLFSAPHEWYMNYHLRDFWRADNDKRISMLHRYKIGAIVVKKHLISQVDKNITNLGVYPRFFINDINKDSRFQKVFNNGGVAIYLTPPLYDSIDE